MSEMVVQGSKYTDQQRTEAAIQYAITGSLTKTQQATGIPHNTMSYWKKESWWVEAIDKVRHEKADEHRAMYSQLVEAAQAKALELLPSTKCAKTAMLVACMGTDKVRLHDGLATSISGKAESKEELLKKFAKIAMDYNKNVVSVQNDTQVLDK